MASVGRSPSPSAAGGAGFTELEEAFFRAGERVGLGDLDAHDFRDLDEPDAGRSRAAAWQRGAPMHASSRWQSVLRWLRG